MNVSVLANESLLNITQCYVVCGAPFMYLQRFFSSRAHRKSADPLAPEKRLSRNYITGLIIIVMLATLTHFIMGRLLLVEQHTASVVDLASKQRMLSQRIVQLTYGYLLARDVPEQEAFRGKTLEAIDQLWATHQRLTTSPLYASYHKATEAVYFQQPWVLDHKMRSFLTAAREVIHTPPVSGTFEHKIMQHVSDPETEIILDTLNVAVQRFVQASNDAVRHLHTTLWFLYAILVLTIVLEGLFIFRPAFKRLLTRSRELMDQARTDALTGCHNRRSFNLLADATYARFKRYHDPCALLVLDIDKFKAINDTYGHATGDTVIASLADTCVNTLRKSDIFGRLGGEEFAAIVHTSDLDKAFLIAEKLRIQIEQMRITLANGKELSITVSIGLSMMSPEDTSYVEALDRADTALYQAKHNGRNQCVSIAAVTALNTQETSSCQA